MMDTNIKATLMACIFTLLLSVGGAYGVLKIDDATMKSKIELIQQDNENSFKHINTAIEAQQHTIESFQRQVEKMTSSYALRTEASMNKLDKSMIRFGDKVELLSNSIARLDERLKPIEARGKANGPN